MSNLQKVLAFALLHDWGQSAYIASCGKVAVCGTSVFVAHPRYVIHERHFFSDLRSLRDWAGY